MLIPKQALHSRFPITICAKQPIYELWIIKILIMAKSKKSRRSRRLETEKRQQISTERASTASSAFSPEGGVNVSKTKTAIDLGTEYYYVYTEVRNILAISVVMFAILFGLGFMI